MLLGALRCTGLYISFLVPRLEQDLGRWYEKQGKWGGLCGLLPHQPVHLPDPKLKVSDMFWRIRTCVQERVAS